MKRMRMIVLLLLCTTLSLALISSAMAATAKVMAYEGQIKSIKVDKCGLQPGSCEGSIVLAQAGGAGEVTLAVKPGTWLKRGDQFVTVDELGVGNYVRVEAVQIPGEQLQRISVLSSEG